MTAVDFSFQKPTVAELQAAGVTAVGRYLTGVGKRIDLPELESYLAVGIVVWFVYEVTATDDQGGFQGGVQAATAANGALQGLQLPLTQPVYFAVDHDVQNPQTAVPYFQGICSVRPWTTNGDYGEGALCQVLHDQNLTYFHWQSESTSFPGNAATLPITHIQQVYGHEPIPGTDLNFILKPDFGQFPAPIPVPPAPPPSEDTMSATSYTTAIQGSPLEQQHIVYISDDGSKVKHWFYIPTDANPKWTLEELPQS